MNQDRPIIVLYCIDIVIDLSAEIIGKNDETMKNEIKEFYFTIIITAIISTIINKLQRT